MLGSYSVFLAAAEARLTMLYLMILFPTNSPKLLLTDPTSLLNICLSTSSSLAEERFYNLNKINIFHYS